MPEIIRPTTTSAGLPLTAEDEAILDTLTADLAAWLATEADELARWQTGGLEFSDQRAAREVATDSESEPGVFRGPVVVNNRLSAPVAQAWAFPASGDTEDALIVHEATP